MAQGEAPGRRAVQLHADAESFLGPAGATGVAEFDVHRMRADLAAATSRLCGPGNPDVTVRHLPPEVLGVPARLYLPGEGTAPLAVFMHGGGWVSGDLDSHDVVCRRLASHGIAVAAIDYRLAPEHRYPAAVADCVEVMDRIGRLAPYGVSTDQVGVIGDSAGGNLAAVLARRDALAAAGQVAAQVLVYPVMDARMDTGSYATFATDYGMTARKMAFYWDEYCPHAARRAEPDAAPGQASVPAATAPTLVITAECDVLRDEGERYALLLAAHGVDAVAVRYPGVSHGFFRMHQAFRAGPIAADQAAQFLLRHVGRPAGSAA